MQLYIKEKVFSWNEKFFVKDALGEDKYVVEGEFFSLGKKLHVYDMQGRELAFVQQELLTLLPCFTVYSEGIQIARIRKEFSFLVPRYSIQGLDWDIEGSFWEHAYRITKNGSPVVTISKEWMTWGDSYQLDIANPADTIPALAVVLTIDCVQEAQNH